MDSAGAETNQQCEIDPADTTDLAEAESSSSGNAESDAHAGSIKPTHKEFVKMKHGKRHESAVLDFSGHRGAYLLPCEFRAGYDEYQEPNDTTGQYSVND